MTDPDPAVAPARSPEVVERAIAFVAEFQGDPHCALNCQHAEALAAEVITGRATHAALMTALAALPDRLVQAVAELSDRTSPDGWPEAMLVTADELRAIVAALLADPVPLHPQPQEKNTVPRSGEGG